MKLGNILKSCGLLLLCSALCTGVSVASGDSLRNEEDATQTAKPTHLLIQALRAAISKDNVDRLDDILYNGGSPVHGIKFIHLIDPIYHPRLYRHFNFFPPSILLSKIFSGPRQAKEEEIELIIYIKPKVILSTSRIREFTDDKIIIH